MIDTLIDSPVNVKMPELAAMSAYRVENMLKNDLIVERGDRVLENRQ